MLCSVWVENYGNQFTFFFLSFFLFSVTINNITWETQSVRVLFVQSIAERKSNDVTIESKNSKRTTCIQCWMGSRKFGTSMCAHHKSFSFSILRLYMIDNLILNGRCHWSWRSMSYYLNTNACPPLDF